MSTSDRVSAACGAVLVLLAFSVAGYKIGTADRVDLIVRAEVPQCAEDEVLVPRQYPALTVAELDCVHIEALGADR